MAGQYCGLKTGKSGRRDPSTKGNHCPVHGLFGPRTVPSSRVSRVERLSVGPDGDGDGDGTDLWYHHAYDERWRMVATYRDDDTDPKEEFVNHQAGLDGFGRSSYIDLVVCRDKDANMACSPQSSA